MDTIEDIDSNLNHWRMKARVARFDNDQGALIEAEIEMDRLLEMRYALVLA